MKDTDMTTFNRRHFLFGTTASVVALAGCSSEISSNSDVAMSSDQRLRIYAIDTQYTDGEKIFTQLIWDNALQRYVVNVSGQGLTWERAIIQNLISPNVIPSLVSGAFGIRIAREGSCGEECGDIVTVSGVSSSNSNSSTSNNVDTTLSTKGALPEVAVVRLGPPARTLTADDKNIIRQLQRVLRNGQPSSPELLELHATALSSL